ncbi:hypothetical protein BIW11_03358 [Tropilaelaps mercedesae]|uniref:Uncharacterized protein n=1 Tax=Tropilaelaps mercedesae TaxID=418985 RepID=A0A1V9XMV6_9ACAR|nr:hypothetical protein BIW11_03358 [Tropilaelaps mercedesae]
MFWTMGVLCVPRYDKALPMDFVQPALFDGTPAENLSTVFQYCEVRTSLDSMANKDLDP